MPDPSAPPIWIENFLGGNGIESDDLARCFRTLRFFQGQLAYP